MLTSSPEQAETIPPKKPASELIYPVRRKTPLFGGCEDYRAIFSGWYGRCSTTANFTVHS